MKNSSKTDWENLSQMSDAEIDYSDTPPLTERFFQEAKLWQPRPKVTVTVEMDADVLEWFKSESDNWEARLQAALRLYVEAHKAYQKT
ncbi:MAG: BrnA antitoxin family protein [Anaerolineae bacterium]|nr:BrnA antitoxin family protein [Anaerolineae bacterium]